MINRIKVNNRFDKNNKLNYNKERNDVTRNKRIPHCACIRKYKDYPFIGAFPLPFVITT